MRITRVPFAVLRFQYQLVRFPLQVLEERVVARMGAEAPARLFYERSLSVLDATVGGALGDPRLRRRGALLADRSDALSSAAALEANATRKQQQADAELNAARDGAIGGPEGGTRGEGAARSRKRGWLPRSASALLLSRPSDARRGEAPGRRGGCPAQEVGRGGQARRAGQYSGCGGEGPCWAESKLDDADAKRRDAASKRAHADCVEQLADAEKRKRQAARARN